MDLQNDTFSSAKKLPKHASLTHLLRHKWMASPDSWRYILSKCNVDHHLGALPPELRARVPKEKLSEVTYEFRVRLDRFLIEKAPEIRNRSNRSRYNVAEIGDLFGTSCIIKTGAVNVYGWRKWEGRYGVVCKMQFPQIQAEYALKIFLPLPKEESQEHVGHGASYEIPTAFAASYAEQADNVHVYMASLCAENYILAAWEGDIADGKIRNNKNKIFVSDILETEARNYRAGRRIDFGATFLTPYGRLPYDVRKLYRCMINAARKFDVDTFAKVVAGVPHQKIQAVIDTANVNDRMFIRDMMARLGMQQR